MKNVNMYLYAYIDFVIYIQFLSAYFVYYIQSISLALKKRGYYNLSFSHLRFYICNRYHISVLSLSGNACHPRFPLPRAKTQRTRQPSLGLPGPFMESSHSPASYPLQASNHRALAGPLLSRTTSVGSIICSFGIFFPSRTPIAVSTIFCPSFS